MIGEDIKEHYAEGIFQAARDAGFVDFWEMTDEQIDKCVIKGITRSKLYPAISSIKWLEEKGKPVPQFDYPVEQLLSQPVGKLRPIFILKYVLYMWVRKGRKRRFLLKHPWLLEKTGDVLYRFPFSIPGYMFGIKAIKLIGQGIRRFR